MESGGWEGEGGNKGLSRSGIKFIEGIIAFIPNKNSIGIFNFMDIEDQPLPSAHESPPLLHKPHRTPSTIYNSFERESH